MSRAESLYLWLMETIDTVLGHPFGCGLLNNPFFAGYNEATDDFRFEIPNPLGALYGRIIARS